MEANYLRVTEEELNWLNKSNQAAIVRKVSDIEEYEDFEEDGFEYRILLLDKECNNIVALAYLVSTHRNTPKQAWKNFGSKYGCTKKNFDKYVENAPKVKTYVLKFCHFYDKAIPLNLVYDLIDDL